jgi:hypothetical protein
LYVVFKCFICCISYDAHNKQLLLSCTTVIGLPTVSHYVLCEVITEVRIMPQLANRWPLSEEARVRSQVNLCVVCGGQSGTRPGFPPNTFVFPRLYHSANAPYSFSLTRCSYQDKRAVSGSLPKSSALYDVGRHYNERCFRNRSFFIQRLK